MAGNHRRLFWAHTQVRQRASINARIRFERSADFGGEDCIHVDSESLEQRYCCVHVGVRQSGRDRVLTNSRHSGPDVRPGFEVPPTACDCFHGSVIGSGKSEMQADFDESGLIFGLDWSPLVDALRDASDPLKVVLPPSSSEISGIDTRDLVRFQVVGDRGADGIEEIQQGALNIEEVGAEPHADNLAEP